MGMKLYKRPLSIGVKTLLSHLLLCVVILVLASVLSYAITSQYMREMRIDDLLEKAGRIAESSHNTPYGQFLPNGRTVRMYEKLTDARVFYLEEDSDGIRIGKFPFAQKSSGEEAASTANGGKASGDTAASPANGGEASGDKAASPASAGEASGDKAASGAAESAAAAQDAEDMQWVEVLDSIDRQFAARVLDGENVTAIQNFAFAQDEIIFAGVPIIDESGAVRGGVVLAQPVAELRSLSRMVRYMLVLVVSVSLLLSVILAMQLTRVLVRPLQRITQTAKRMEEGLYAERITELPGDEIGELGHALNSMSGRLMDVIRSIRKERDKLELVISGIGEGLIAVDTGWHIIHANEAFLELAELDSASRFLEEGVERLEPLREMLGRCMISGQETTLEWENRSHRALHATATAFVDEGGAILGTVCLLRDISETQRMEQLRRDYVANISHELRTPLTGIRGMVEPLIDGCMDTEEERLDSYRIILKETIRLEKLVGEMLDMSRLQDGRLKVELEVMELPGILEAAARNMKRIADESGIDLRVETDGSRLRCLGNEDRITQVLVILIDNALSFTPRGGSVTVFARDGADCVHVGVRDTGCGIEPKDLPFIWERFYKADKSRMRTTGTGLGLSIAKLVVQVMGGDIAVRSKPGEGAEFTFTLKKP